MADIIISSSEPLKLISLFEQLFPGIDLTSMVKILTGVKMKTNGSLHLEKAISNTESVELNITINPDPVVKK